MTRASLRHKAGGRRVAGLLATAAVALCLWPAGASALTDADELGRFGSEGAAAGQLRFPTGSATDPLTGHLYVIDGAGAANRISEFTPWGEFVKAFGGDVAPGAVNEQQEVRVRAGAGSFRLGFEGSETPDLTFDATAAEVQAALNALSTIGGAGGSVLVTEALGKPATATPYVHVVVFKGSLAGTDVGQLTASNGAVPLSAGNPSTELEARTRADGTPGGTGLESCTAESGCQEGSVGSAPGQLSVARLIAVDPAGNLYVGHGDSSFGPPRVQKFDSAGRFLLVIGGEVDKTTGANLCTATSGHECGGAVAGSGPGEFDATISIAINPAGQLLARSGKRIQRFNAAGEYQSEIEAPSPIFDLAVDPITGDIYVFRGGKEGKVSRLDSTTGAELSSFDVVQPIKLATGPSGEIFVVQDVTDVIETPFHHKRVLQYDKGGNLVSTFAEAELDPELPNGIYNHFQVDGIAANALGDLYVANHNSSHQHGAFIRFFGPPPVSFESPPRRAPRIATQYAASVGVREAELGARIDPRFWNDTAFHLEYGTAPCTAGGCTATTDVTLTQKVVGSAIASQSVFLEGLQPGTTYHYRAVAESSGGGPVYGIDPDDEGPEEASFEEGLEGTFTTYRPPEAPSCPANEAFRTGPSAQLPDCRAYEMVSPIDKEGGDIVVLTDVTAKAPAVLAQSSLDGGRLAYGSVRSFGAASSAPFTTQYVAARKAGQGWATHGTSAPHGKTVYQGALEKLDTEIRAFSPDLCEAWFQSYADMPVELEPLAPRGFSNLFRRSDEECGGPAYEALNTTTPPTVGGELFHIDLLGLSGDGSTAVFVADDAIAPGASPATPMADGNAGPFQLYAARGGQQRFLCVLPGGSNWTDDCTAGGGKAGQEGRGRQANVTGALSADGERVYWRAGNEGAIYLRENPMQPQSAFANGSATGSGKLTAGSTAVTTLIAAQGKASFTAGSATVTLLETTTGRFVAGQPVSAGKTLPGGTTIESIAGNTLTLSAAATETIEKSITSVGPMPFAIGQTIRAPGIPTGTTITEVKAGGLTLSKAATTTKSGVPLETSSQCTELEKACTIPVSEAAEAIEGVGSSQFRQAAKDGSRVLFTTEKSPTEKTLYEWRAEDKSTHEIAGELTGFLGAGEDATRVYFVSKEAKGGPNGEGKSAVAGQPNLYFYEAGQFRFIGALVEPSSVFSPVTSVAFAHTARVSADGLHAAFQSRAPLTDYDNTDLSSEGPAAEVFLYDAAAGGGQGALLCASCNPSGARPHGAFDKEQRMQTAGRIPGFANNLYASRVLSDDGSRLFFESYDALTPLDTNGVKDVYQWEAPGSGGCDGESPSFSALNGGCVDLISSGKSARGSDFVDASPSGEDVFIATLSSLVPQDPGLVDVYDARVAGGLPSPALPPAACEGEACQSSPVAPNDPTPASAAFEGPGNVKEGAARKRARCAEGKVRRRGRCVAKKLKSKHRAKHDRRQAR